MPKTSDPRRHWWRHPAWPSADRELWLASSACSDELTFARYGDHLRPASLATIERSYGRYLCFLAWEGQLIEDERPGQRITPPRLAAYLRQLTELGARSQSMIIAISGLRSAVRIMDPSADTSWLWYPNGASLARHLRGPRKAFNAAHSADLFEWGQSLITCGKQSRGKQNDLLTIRDGLMISLLACRPIRRRTMAGLTLGKQIIHTKEGWKLVLSEDDMKNRRAVEFFLPPELTPDIDYYLREVRPRLIGPNPTDAFWIGRDGKAITVNTVSAAVWKHAVRKYGQGFGPHRFRHAYSTMAIDADPTRPGMPASVLAVGASMVEKHYNLGNTTLASRSLEAALREERKQSEAFAQRVFEQTRNKI